jgi:hypothetical protein
MKNWSIPPPKSFNEREVHVIAYSGVVVVKLSVSSIPLPVHDPSVTSVGATGAVVAGCVAVVPSVASAASVGSCPSASSCALGRRRHDEPCQHQQPENKHDGHARHHLHTEHQHTLHLIRLL